MKRYIKPILKKNNLKSLNKIYLKFNEVDIEWLLRDKFFAQCDPCHPSAQ